MQFRKKDLRQAVADLHARMPDREPFLTMINAWVGRLWREAINPRFTRDFESDVSAVRVPVYFLQDSNRGLIGGVEVGWRSDTKSTAVAAFVGAALRLVNVR